MEARFEDLNIRKGTESFRAFRLNVPKFEFNWHYHPEYELTYIENGRGKRLIGDNYEGFEPGDLVLVGKGLPHTWATDSPDNGVSSAIVIQFNEYILQSLLQLSEFEWVKKLLDDAQRGLHYPQKNIPAIIRAIQSLPGTSGVNRVTVLLNILSDLSMMPAVSLASAYFQPLKGDLNEKRIAKVCEYIQNNTANSINLNTAADLVHLSKSAFCKFFKRTTGKTFSDYISEVRIGHACRLLSESDKTIADICYHAGFESPTYFNRVFLKKKGIKPREFRNRK